jgi:hypothetical protein
MINDNNQSRFATPLINETAFTVEGQAAGKGIDASGAHRNVSIRVPPLLQFPPPPPQ